MSSVLVLPVGVTKGTVEGVLSSVGNSLVGVITVTTTGFSGVKEDILAGVKAAAKLLGIGHRHIVIGFGDREASAKIYRALREFHAERVVVSGVTGSRYLYPIIYQAVLRYSRDTGSEILLLHGIEGDKWSVQPLTGFITTGLKRAQKKVFRLIYSMEGDVIETEKDIVSSLGLTRASYKVLKELEQKGLIKVGRRRIEKTLPGHMLHNLMMEAGEL